MRRADRPGYPAAVCAALVACAALAAGCKDKGRAAADQALAKSETIAQQEDSLLARRDALVKERERIRAERDRLEQRRRAAIAAGDDTSEIDEQARSLLERERDLADEEEELNQRFRDILRERRALMAQLATGGGGDPTAAVAARERDVAARERELSSREQTLADREAKLAQREAALARREAQMCGVAAQPQTIIKTVDAKGSAYTKKDVEPLLSRARAAMAKKGILRSDLPPPARDLDREATRAMAEGDYGRARFAARQLVDTVKSIRIDKAFIQGKIGRLNAEIAGKTLDAATKKKIDALFRAATEDYGDGKFSRANRRLNQIYALLD
ncbi:MAG: hypothetical protein D6689_15500 [Deltaproteobacteria bacterium]|nr:MAG: hypothetical protein D6689_15500 [Deltaproteobacteria bacterium]